MKNHLVDNIIFEDDDLLILSISSPITFGHVVIRPKKNFLQFDELPEFLLMKILNMAQYYVRVLKKYYDANGYSLMHHGGEYNLSDGFELHVIPRQTAEEFSWTYSDVVVDKAKDFETVKELLLSDFRKEYTA